MRSGGLSRPTPRDISASRHEYERVQEILENENIRYPRVLYRSLAAPSPLHAAMAGCILTNFRDEAIQLQQMAHSLTQMNEESTSINTAHGNTTRKYDGALVYSDGNDYTLMVAVEIGVSQNYQMFYTFPQLSVCALRCRIGIAMLIKEGKRGRTPRTRWYASTQEAPSIFFSGLLAQRPYGPLVWDGVTWFGKVQQVVLETYRCQDENVLPDTVLNPSQSIVIVRNGQFVCDDMPANLRELVLGDCIPTHSNFRIALSRTAVGRVRSKSEVITQPEPA
ncbi:hypothetical protein V1515DRAFT_617517 [Lipomyces mesembrius]